MRKLRSAAALRGPRAPRLLRLLLALLTARMAQARKSSCLPATTMAPTVTTIRTCCSTTIFRRPRVELSRQRVLRDGGRTQQANADRRLRLRPQNSVHSPRHFDGRGAANRRPARKTTALAAMPEMWGRHSLPSRHPCTEGRPRRACPRGCPRQGLSRDLGAAAATRPRSSSNNNRPEARSVRFRRCRPPRRVPQL